MSEIPEPDPEMSYHLLGYEIQLNRSCVSSQPNDEAPKKQCATFCTSAPAKNKKNANENYHKTIKETNTVTKENTSTLTNSCFCCLRQLTNSVTVSRAVEEGS